MSSRVVCEEVVIPEDLAQALQEAFHYVAIGSDYFSVSVGGWEISYDGIDKEAK